MKLFCSSLIVILISTVLFSCTDSTSSNDDSSLIGKVTLTIDNKAITLNPDKDVISMSYVNGNHLVLSVMSESNDLQFGISAYSTSLGKKTLSVYDCNGPSQCDMAESDENQFALFAPYVKDPLPPISDSRSAYKAPDLGITPLAVTITDVLVEQLAGSGFPTKKVKGTFSGTLVYIEEVDGKWQVKGSTKVDGAFDVFCTIQ